MENVIVCLHRYWKKQKICLLTKCDLQQEHPAILSGKVEKYLHSLLGKILLSVNISPDHLPSVIVISLMAKKILDNFLPQNERKNPRIEVKKGAPKMREEFNKVLPTEPLQTLSSLEAESPASPPITVSEPQSVTSTTKKMMDTLDLVASEVRQTKDSLMLSTTQAIKRSFSSGSRFLQPSQDALSKQSSLSCAELPVLNDNEDMDQRIMENYCEGEIQLEDSIEKLRKLLDQREKDRENSNYLRSMSDPTKEKSYKECSKFEGVLRTYSQDEVKSASAGNQKDKAGSSLLYQGQVRAQNKKDFTRLEDGTQPTEPLIVEPTENLPTFGEFLRKETENLLPTAHQESGQKIQFFCQKSPEKIETRRIKYEYKLEQVVFKIISSLVNDIYY